MLLNQKADVNAQSRDDTVLRVAAGGGHEKVTEMLLNQIADVNARSEDYGTALIAAAARGSEKV